MSEFQVPRVSRKNSGLGWGGRGRNRTHIQDGDSIMKPEGAAKRRSNCLREEIL